ncbi:hypothetical protein Tco_0827693, partial [Tanacetum coccineum]
MKHGVSAHASDDVIKDDSIMVKVELNPECDYGSLEGHCLGRKFKSSTRLQGVINGQPQSTIENTKMHMVRDMMWFALQYMKVKESELILPHLSLSGKPEFDNIQSMYLNELLKISLVGVTAGNKGLNVYQACEKIDCDGLIYAVNSYVNLVNMCYNADTRGLVKGVKAGAYQAMFCYNLGSAGNSFQENVKILFGLNDKILKGEKDWKAYDIHIPLPTGQVNNGKLNFLILSANLQSLVCALHIDSNDMKILECLFLSGLKTLLENVAVDLPSQFTSSKLTNVELITSRLKGALFIDKGHPYLQVKKHNRSSLVGPLMHWDQIDLENLLLALENINIKEWIEQFKTEYLGEASAADDSLTFNIYEASVLSMLVAPFQFATTRVIYNVSGGRNIILQEVNRATMVVKWLVKWKWKSKVTIHRHDPWGQGSFKGEGVEFQGASRTPWAPKLSLENYLHLDKLDLISSSILRKVSSVVDEASSKCSKSECNIASSSRNDSVGHKTQSQELMKFTLKGIRSARRSKRNFNMASSWTGNSEGYTTQLQALDKIKGHTSAKHVKPNFNTVFSSKDDSEGHQAQSHALNTIAVAGKISAEPYKPNFDKIYTPVFSSKVDSEGHKTQSQTLNEIAVSGKSSAKPVKPNFNTVFNSKEDFEIFKTQSQAPDLSKENRLAPNFNTPFCSMEDSGGHRTQFQPLKK